MVGRETAEEIRNRGPLQELVRFSTSALSIRIAFNSWPAFSNGDSWTGPWGVYSDAGFGSNCGTRLKRNSA